MTDLASTAPATPVRRRGRWLRPAGWALIGVGGLILLYLGYLLVFTNFRTAQAQDAMLENWSLEYGDPSGTPISGAPGPSGTSSADVGPGDAYAVLSFERPGSDARLVHDAPLFVVEGVDVASLRRGPGHYPESAAPGSSGNLAIAGHRTTSGAPFYHLDQLRSGDRAMVVDRQGTRWTYEVVETRVVKPTETWVVGPDPLATGRPTLTLTTCEPRFSAANRLIVFAELVPGG